MRYVAQSKIKGLGGKNYEPGDDVPDSAAARRLAKRGGSIQAFPGGKASSEAATADTGTTGTTATASKPKAATKSAVAKGKATGPGRPRKNAPGAVGGEGGPPADAGKGKGGHDVETGREGAGPGAV